MVWIFCKRSMKLKENSLRSWLPDCWITRGHIVCKLLFKSSLLFSWGKTTTITLQSLSPIQWFIDNSWPNFLAMICVTSFRCFYNCRFHSRSSFAWPEPDSAVFLIPNPRCCWSSPTRLSVHQSINLHTDGLGHKPNIICSVIPIITRCTERLFVGRGKQEQMKLRDDRSGKELTSKLPTIPPPHIRLVDRE